MGGARRGIGFAGEGIGRRGSAKRERGASYSHPDSPTHHVMHEAPSFPGIPVPSPAIRLPSLRACRSAPHFRLPCGMFPRPCYEDALKFRRNIQALSLKLRCKEVQNEQKEHFLSGHFMFVIYKNMSHEK